MLTRRQFNRRLLAGLAIAGTGIHLPSQAASRHDIDATHRDWLNATLPEIDRRFDPFARMLVAPAADLPGHRDWVRTGDVHPTRASLNYAVALLDTGDSDRVQRANEMLRVILGLQGLDAAGETSGHWPAALEEPLANSPAPPFDYAAFCALPLLMAWMLHRKRIAPHHHEPIRQAILGTALFLQRRDLTKEPASAALPATGVLLLAAQEIKQPELRASAKERLHKLYADITRDHSFAEGGSPARMTLIVQELSRLLWLVKDARHVTLLRELHDRAWRDIATRFHAPTRQWAGPHSESDETDLRRRPEILAVIENGTGLRGAPGPALPLPLSLENYRLPVVCPRKYLRHFTQLDTPREVTSVIAAESPAQNSGARPDVHGTTWLHPRFTIGTAKHGDFGERQRPFLVYWGTAAAPRSLRLRVLKDGVDFAAGLYYSTQLENRTLAVVTFRTDHDDPRRPRDLSKNGSFAAQDLRLRLEFGGELANCTVKTIEAADGTSSIVIQDQNARFVVRPVSGKFGENTPRWNLPELSLAKHLDAVLHTGENQTIDLSRLTEAFICFAFEEWPYAERELPSARIETQLNAGRLHARWATRRKTLELAAPIRPANLAAMNDVFRRGVA